MSGPAVTHILERLAERSTGAGRDWRCPGHEDRNASLSVSDGPECALVFCHAGCPAEQVMAALDLPTAALYDKHWTNGNGNGNGKREIVASYGYTDEDGKPLFEVVRFAPKDFRQRRPDGSWGVKGVRRVLYRLPQIMAAGAAGETVYVVEGEKDVHAIEKAGQVATCSPGGAGKWRREYNDMLRGAQVVVVADRDKAGRKHAFQVAAALASVAGVRVVEPAAGKDAHDHLKAGHGLDELVAIEGSPQAEPPPEIDGHEIAGDVRAFIARYMVLPSEEAADLLTLWTLHTWAFQSAWATPYLRIVSAVPESGKTLLMEILAAISRNGWHAVNPSPAVLYRKVDAFAPTLLLDEIDNFPIDEKRDALAVLNSGYKRGATVDRCKENGDLQSFSCFCPKAYAGLDTKALVPALLSRSVTIRLERKARHERVERWIGQRIGQAAEKLRADCSAWAHHHGAALEAAEPELPDSLGDRACEVWWALLAIADEIGAGWPARARSAAETLSTGGDPTDDVPVHERLLDDIREAFGDAETMFTKDLLERLNADEEGPWKARRRGEGLDARGLSRLLRPFGIKPRTVRVSGEASTSRGYHVDQFGEAFARHLPEATQATQATHPASDGDLDVSDVSDVSATEGAPVDGWNGWTDAELQAIVDAGAER